MIPEEIEVVFLRPGMYVGEETYNNVTTFISGYHYRRGINFNIEFTDWLLREYKIRSCQYWPYYVAYIFNRKNNEPFGALSEEEKLKYLYEMFKKFYERDNIVKN